MTPIGFLAIGAVLGLGGGLSPGPLTALICAETLRHGGRAGARLSITPLITDAPLLVLSGAAAATLAEFQTIEAFIALAGAGFLLYLTWDTARTAGIPLDEDVPSAGLRKAVLTNVFNPHPYVFWLAVGGPLVAEAHATSTVSLAAFLAGFFGCIVGSKAVMAALIGRFRGLLSGAGYRWTMRGLAFGMLLLALRFAEDGLSSLLAMG